MTIAAVAITDHFLIDANRIRHLRSIAPDIVFFPGVELRTDKGANNLHLIMIFPNSTDLDILSADFDAWKRDKAKSAYSDETIYWTFEDADNLMAGTGTATLKAAYKTEEGPKTTDDPSEAEIEPVEGPLEDNKAITMPVSAYLMMSNNTGFAELTDYTIMLDVNPLVLKGYHALLQTNPRNNTDGGFFIKNGMIVGIGDYEGKEEIDIGGQYVTSGFINAHIHLESTMTSTRMTRSGMGTSAVLNEFMALSHWKALFCSSFCGRAGVFTRRSAN